MIRRGGFLGGRGYGMKRRKAWAGLAAAALLLGVLYFALADFLVSAALVPSFMEKLEAFERITEESYAAQAQGPDISRNLQESRAATGRWLETAERRKVTARTEDGYALVAEEFPAEGKSRRWAILLHGYTGWKEEMYPFACWYHAEGYHVIAPDLRCHGESEGDFIGMGWTDHFDCMIWVRHILEQDPEAEIVLHGQSMGAATALMMAGEELPGNVRAVISDCAYTDAYAVFREKITEWFSLPAFPFVDTARLILMMRGGYDLKDASPISAVKKSGVPILFIHGGEDRMMPDQMSRELYRAASCEKELLIVEGAGHAQSQDKDPAAYFGAVEKFLEKVFE